MCTFFRICSVEYYHQFIFVGLLSHGTIARSKEMEDLFKKEDVTFFAPTSQTINKSMKYLKAEVFCALYACSDELHQYFVPGRSCRFFDVCVDSTGAFFGALLFWGMYSCLSKRKRQEIFRVDGC